MEHKDIPDAQIHEPKGIISAAGGAVYVATGSSTGTWRKVREAEIDYTDKTQNKFGWNYVKDNQYTSGSPLAITATTKTLFPNNGLATLSDVTRPLGITYGTNQFTPTALNASYVIRIACKVTAAAAAGTPYTFKITMEGGSPASQFAGQDQFIKGGGYVNDITLSFLFFTGTNNTNQPIKIYITPDTNVNVYDLDFLIQRTYVET